MIFTLRRNTALAGGTREEPSETMIPAGIPIIGAIGVTAAVLAGGSFGYSFLGAVLLNEVGTWWARKNRRGQYYRLAQARANDTGRPLIMIGDPDVATRGDVGYGDMCVDLTGCPKAPAGVTKVKADITKPGSIPAKDNSSVVMVSGVLEYVSDIDAAWKEILRVAGSPWNVFVLSVEPASLCAWWYHGARQVILEAPPTSPVLRYESVGPVLTWMNERKSSIGS